MTFSKKSIIGITEMSIPSTPKPIILGVVGRCPACGAPIYGYDIIHSDEEPLLKYSCNCRNVSNKTFDSTIHYK